MFNTNEGYSLADIAAATNNNTDSFNNGSWWIIILFFLLIFGYGGNRVGTLGGATTSSTTNSGITDGYILTSDFASLQRQIDNGFDGIRQQGVQIANGISSLGYDQLNQMNGINTNINNTQNTIVSTLNSGFNSLGAQINANEASRQNCCCQTNNLITTNFADLNYNLASQSCQTRQSISDVSRDLATSQAAQTQAILEKLNQMEANAKDDKIATLTSQVNALQTAADNAAQTAAIINQLRTPSPIPAYNVPSPYTSIYGCSCSGYNT